MRDACALRFTRYGIALALAGCATTSSGVVINNTAVPPVPTLNPDQVAQGEQMYAQHCAACHGAQLEGEPNWKQRKADDSFPAPPHDASGHTWHHSDELLLHIIAAGGDPALNSKMPAFNGTLSDEQMQAVLEFIKSKWGRDEREYQWWITYNRNDHDLIQP